MIQAVPLPPWTGAPLDVTLGIPNDPAFIDVFVHLQVGLIDAGGAHAGLTDGLELKLGG